MSTAHAVGNDFLQHVFSHTILVTITLFLVMLRTFVKLRIVRNIGPEDFAVLLAMLFALIYTAISIREKDYARQQFSISTIEKRLKCVYIGAIFYGFSLACTKFSFLLQYLRIFHHKTMRIAIWVVFAIVIIYSIWAFFQSILPCLPPSDFWKISKIDKHCVDAIKFYTAHAAISVVTDVFLLLLPIPGLRKLMLPPAQKFGLLMVFMLGGFTCVASSLRLSMFAHAKDGVFFTQWAGRSIGTWTAIEMNVAIICCCLPPLRPLATRTWRKLRQSKYRKRSHRFMFPGIFGLSSFFGTEKLSLLLLSSKSKTSTTAASKPDSESPGERSHEAKNKEGDGTSCSNTNTNDLSTISRSVHKQASTYIDYSRILDDVAINESVLGSLTRSNAATPDALGHNNEKGHEDLHQHCVGRQDERMSHHYHEYNRNECRRSSISWLSLSETVYDESLVAGNYNEYSLNEMYESGFPGTAV